jgi:hypothetical protein
MARTLQEERDHQQVPVRLHGLTTKGNGHISAAGAMDKLKAPSEAQNKDLSAVVRRNSIQRTTPEQRQPNQERTYEQTTKENGHISLTSGAMDNLKAPSEAQNKDLSAAVRCNNLHCTTPEQRQSNRE